MIRSRPDTSPFEQPKKDPTDFLASGRATLASAAPQAPAPTMAPPPQAEPEQPELDLGAHAPSSFSIPVAVPPPVTQKLFRLRFDTAHRLKVAAAEQSVSQGRRVTETELVEQLIVKHLKPINHGRAR